MFFFFNKMYKCRCSFKNVQSVVNSFQCDIQELLCSQEPVLKSRLHGLSLDPIPIERK